MIQQPSLPGVVVWPELDRCRRLLVAEFPDISKASDESRRKWSRVVHMSEIGYKPSGDAVEMTASPDLVRRMTDFLRDVHGEELPPLVRVFAGEVLVQIESCELAQDWPAKCISKLVHWLAVVGLALPGPLGGVAVGLVEELQGLLRG